MESNNTLYNEIETIYKRDDKSKRFITHLIRSYLPLENLVVINKSSSDLKCSLSKQKLKGIDDLSTKIDNVSALLIKDIAFKINVSTEKIDLNISDNIAFTGSNTKTFLSQEAYIALIDFVSKSLKTDKHIEWLIRKMNIKLFLNKVLGIKPNTKKKISHNYIPKRVPTATTTLGDLDVLQQLREKMKN